MTRSAGVRAILAASLAFALLAPAVAAQEPGARLTGILVSEGDGAPVDGAVVSLADLDDVVLWETLSSASGAFSLPLPPPGTYRVRVSRIGYDSWTSGPVRIDSAQASGPLRFEIPVRPVPLPELMVTEQNDCPTTPEERRRAFELYESVLPILASMSTAETGDSLLVRLERPVRIWKGGRFGYRRDTVTVMVTEALSNASPGHLEAYGYAEAIHDTLTTFYAPDGAALASPGFLATHCLSPAADDEDEDAVVGMAFEPRPGRDVVDVRGVLWIDTVPVEPRELAFHYTSLRPFLRRHWVPQLWALRDEIETRHHRPARIVGAIRVQESRFGGHLRFERVAGDRWMIREWRMLTPRLGSYTFSHPRWGSDVSPIAEPFEHSGEVLALFRRTDRSPP